MLVFVTPIISCFNSYKVWLKLWQFQRGKLRYIRFNSYKVWLKLQPILLLLLQILSFNSYKVWLKLIEMDKYGITILFQFLQGLIKTLLLQ